MKLSLLQKCYLTCYDSYQKQHILLYVTYRLWLRNTYFSVGRSFQYSSCKVRGGFYIVEQKRWEVTSDMWKSVSSYFQSPRSELKKQGAAEFFKPSSSCFDIISQTINNSRRNSKRKFTNDNVNYLKRPRFQNLVYDSDLLCFSFMNH